MERNRIALHNINIKPTYVTEVYIKCHHIETPGVYQQDPQTRMQNILAFYHINTEAREIFQRKPITQKKMVENENDQLHYHRRL